MKTKLIKNAVLSGTLLLGFSSVAFADLRVYSANIERAKSEARADGKYGFIQTGTSGEVAGIVNGFSNGMALLTSLQGIIPDNSWRINLNEGAENILVSWRGGLPWPYVLENLARDNNLKISIDWSSKIVEAYSQEVALAQEAKRLEQINTERLIDENKRYAGNVNANANSNANADANADANANANAYFQKLISGDRDKHNSRNGSKMKLLPEAELYKMSNVLAADGNMRNLIDSVYNKTFNERTDAIYILKAGTMLSDNLNIWSNVAGWSFERNSKVDFRITRDIIVRGSLEKAIEKTVLMYIESTKPLKLEMHRANRVIEMKDFIFTSKQVGGERVGGI